MKRILIIIGLLFWSYAATAAPSTKYDGQWTLNIHRDCDKIDHTVIIVIKDSKLVSSQIFLDITGKIADNGLLTIIVSYNGTTLYSKGHLTTTEGAGDWQTENPTRSCSGKWKAIKSAK